MQHKDLNVVQVIDDFGIAITGGLASTTFTLRNSRNLYREGSFNGFIVTFTPNFSH